MVVATLSTLFKATSLSLLLAMVVSWASISYADSMPININTATLEQLADGLIGIGEKKAQAIIQLRDNLGGFIDFEQLLQVKGIGEATLAKNIDNIVLQE